MKKRYMKHLWHTFNIVSHFGSGTVETLGRIINMLAHERKYKTLTILEYDNIIKGFQIYQLV